MKRREFLSLVGGASVWPLSATAQQPGILVIGVLGAFPLDTNSTSLAGLRKGLGEAGLVEGRNFSIDARWAPGAQYEKLLALAVEMVARPVAVLVASGSAGVARAAKAATSTIPIVFANGSDPIRVGLVASMNRPGGNATGVSFFASTLGPKRLELLRELLQKITTVALLVNPSNPVTAGDIQDMENAARSVGQRMIVLRASNESEIDAAFATVATEPGVALIVNVDAFFSGRRHQLAALAARYRVPASYNNSEYSKAGGLMSYGDNRLDSYRHVGNYVARILKGEKPADLPVIQPTKFELTINLKTAKALGIDVPPTLLALADEVIE